MTGLLSVCSVLSSFLFAMPPGEPSTKCQSFWGIQTNNSAAVWGSSVLPGHFSVDEIKETWASGGSEKHWPCAYQPLSDLHSFLEYWPCFSWRCVWGDVEGNRVVCPHFWRRYGSPASQRSVQGCFPAAGLLSLQTPILLAPAWYVWAVLATLTGWWCSCLPSAFPPGSGPLPTAEGWPGAAPSGETLLCVYLPPLGSKLPLAPSHGPLALPSAQLACSASAYISSSSWPYSSSTAGCCPLLW